MNRKQRRAQASAQSRPAAGDAATLLTAAAEFHRQGRLNDAQALYRRVLALDPRHAGALHRLGLVAYQMGQASVAIDLLDRALTIDGRNAAVHTHRGLALAAAGRLDEACAACRAAITIDPASVEAHANLGLLLLQSGQFEAAADASRRTIALAPTLADGHNILGGALQALGRTQEAIESHRRALDLAPDYAEAHTSLGNALSDIGRLDEAVAQHRRALDLQPGFAEAHNNLGQALLRLGRLDEAADQFAQAAEADPAFVVAHSNLAGAQKAQGRLDAAAATLRRAAATAPNHPVILNNLALVLHAQGDAQGAVETVLHGLAAAETPTLRQTFVHCVRTLQIDGGADLLRPWLTRALQEAWGRPEDLVRIILDVVRQGPALQAAMARADIDDGLVDALAADALLRLVLTLTPNIDIEIERVLARARALLLEKASRGAELSGAQIGFYAALAQQAFINEYVFSLAPDDADRARRLVAKLSGALGAGEAAPLATVLAVACYQPLFRVPLAESLVAHSWPAAVQDVLRLQVQEPVEEARLRADIPRLTPILESSLGVQAQYEDNPYPRWIKTSLPDALEPLGQHLQRAFPHADIAPVATGEIDVLIAGCGTGRNALETHRAVAGARTLAIDLSVTSLAYGWRKARQLGETRIEFAQADLLGIAALGREFDLIEASGVLHHLEDPFAGWRALLAVLRPGGVMRLGFYSALARRNLPRQDLAELTPDALRIARQELADRDDPMALQALRAQDFYSLSGCLDLLFHTREHRLDLGALADFLREANLRFVGLVVDDHILAAYQARFPDDPGGLDLASWAAFEADHPDTFARMYQFWVQRR